MRGQASCASAYRGPVALALGLVIQMSPDVAEIVGYTRDRVPQAERAEARERFILDHDPAAAAQSDGPQLTATYQPPHELSR